MKTLHLSIITIVGIVVIVMTSIGVFIEKLNDHQDVFLHESNNHNLSHENSMVIPSITLSSDKASAGNIIQVSGRGFVQSAPVKITLPDNSVIDITTSPGTYISTLGMSGEYGSDNAHFCYPASVALDNTGDIYVADSGNNRIQKFSSSGTYLSTLGVSGPYMSTAGVSGKSDTIDSHFRTPENVALDSS